MKSRAEIMEALDKISRIALQKNEGETTGEFYGRMHFVDGLRRCAMELSNWIISDSGLAVHEAISLLHEAGDEDDSIPDCDENSGLSSNGRARNLKVQIEPDLVAEIDRREMKLSDALNNALALYYKKQLRRSMRSARRSPRKKSDWRYGRLIQRISIDEDLYDELNEQMDAIAAQYDVQRYRASIVNATLRMYLWASGLIDLDPDCTETQSKPAHSPREKSTESELVGAASR